MKMSLLKKMLAAALSFTMILGLVSIAEVSAASEFYSFTQDFENFTKNDIGNKRINNEMNYFYTNGTYDS